MRLLLLVIIAVILNISCNSTQNQIVLVDGDIQLILLKDSVFMHVSWDETEGWGRFSSNGLIIIQNGEAIMVDTPMDDLKTRNLVNFLNDKMGVRVIKVISGHYHDDCIGGLPYLHSLGVVSIAGIKTAEKCLEQGLPVPQMPFSDSFTFELNGLTIVCRYFGPGHAPDNIVVWIPEMKILFGGCLLRSMEASGLGNLSDAVVAEWDATVEKVMEAFPEAEIVVPGHGNYGGKELLSHTIFLVKQHKN
jgi:metallo-beta-lactamase class B